MVEIHLGLLIPLGVLGLVSFFAVAAMLILVAEEKLVPSSRITDHSDSCYANYWRRLDKEHDRIRHLERELRRVPAQMRSRKTKKLVGSGR